MKATGSLSVRSRSVTSMASSDNNKGWWGLFQDIYQRLTSLERRVRQLENKNKRPTLSERLRKSKGK
jgi:hypothetical protein